MKKWFAILALSALFSAPQTLKADLWVGGHGDIGIGLVGNKLDLHLHLYFFKKIHERLDYDFKAKHNSSSFFEKFQ